MEAVGHQIAFQLPRLVEKDVADVEPVDGLVIDISANDLIDLVSLRSGWVLVFIRLH